MEGGTVKSERNKNGAEGLAFPLHIPKQDYPNSIPYADPYDAHIDILGVPSWQQDMAIRLRNSEACVWDDRNCHLPPLLNGMYGPQPRGHDFRGHRFRQPLLVHCGRRQVVQYCSRPEYHGADAEPFVVGRNLKKVEMVALQTLEQRTAFLCRCHPKMTSLCPDTVPNTAAGVPSSPESIFRVSHLVAIVGLVLMRPEEPTGLPG